MISYHFMCVDHTMGITTIPKNGMLGVTEVSYHFWYDIHTSFFTVQTVANQTISISVRGELRNPR